MSEWKEYTLGDLYKVSSGLSKAADQFGFGHTFISFKDVFWNYFIPEKPQGLVNSNEKEQSTCNVSKGDILITRTSESLDEVGMTSVALKDYPNSTFNGFSKRLRLRRNAPIEISPLFMGYMLRTRFFRRSVANYATMTTRASLNGESIQSIPLSFPPIHVQEEIGKILHSLDKKITLLRQQNQTLEELAQTLFKRWFVEFEFPDENGRPYKSSGGKMVESELGEIPEGWRVGTIGDIYKTTSGGTPSRKVDEYYIREGIPWIKSKELNDVYVIETEEYISEEGLKKSSAKLLPENTVLVAMYGATVGQLSITSAKKMTCNQAICAILEGKYSFPFVYSVLNFFKKDWTGLAIGSAQQNLSQVAIAGYEIVIPPIDVEKSFSEKIKPLYKNIQNNFKEIQTLTQLRDTLLPKLMSGEVRVKSV